MTAWYWLATIFLLGVTIGMVVMYLMWYLSMTWAQIEYNLEHLLR